MMPVVGLESLAARSAEHAVNTLAEGLLLTTATWLVLRVFRVRNSVLRFAIWFFMLLAVVSLPLFFTEASSPVRSSWPGHRLVLSSHWATALFVAWTVIAGLLLIRLAVSLWHVRQLGREARDIVCPDLVEVVENSKVGRKLRLCVSDRVRVPTAIGFFRPAILLPSWLLKELPPEELRVILLHEVAHLHRWDDWTNLVQKLLKAIFFFHPAVWWIESRLLLERELACDHMVLAQTENPRAYAASLVSLAERIFAKQMGLGKALLLAQNALGRLRQTSVRLAEILDSSRSRSKRSWRLAVGIVAAFTVGVFGTLPYAPEMIGFSRPERSSIAPPVRAPQLLAAAVPRPSIEFTHKTALPAKSRSQVIPATARWSQKAARRTLVTRASYPAGSGGEMLVVVESERSESGQAVWTLCVWHIRSVQSKTGNLEESIVLNSI